MFRFTIRELVMAVIVVGIGLGWWVTQNENARLREENAHLRLIEDEAVEWKRSANEQKLRADFVSDQLHDKLRLHRECPKCGTLVQFPPLEGNPWTPPMDSIWNRRSLITP
jgi:hypothetical protein